MDGDDARARFSVARVARLATVNPSAEPHLVPIVFVAVGDTLYNVVDAKPKRTTELKRLANVEANPEVCVLVDHYDDADWRLLWWVRGDGFGRVLHPDDAEAQRAIDALAAKYQQYREQRPNGPVLAIDVRRWSGWAAG